MWHVKPLVTMGGMGQLVFYTAWIINGHTENIPEGKIPTQGDLASP